MSEQARLDFAIACATSLQYMKFVAYGAKKASPVLAMNIERESRGAVKVEEVRPDLVELWTYMRNTSPVVTPPIDIDEGPDVAAASVIQKSASYLEI